MRGMGWAVRVLLSLALIAGADQALAQAAPQAPLSASPGRSGGEGGGNASDVTVKAATKENPILQTVVGQPSGPPKGGDPASRCLRLAWDDFSTTPDAPTQIIDVAIKPAAKGAPDTCIVNGYIAPQIAFRIWMPLTAWNSKYMQAGCGGRCGALIPTACEYQITRGYACLAADMGHRGTTYDNIWSVGDVDAQIDFGFRSTHVAAIIGKVITTHFYSKPPTYSYFVGASRGGGQALIEIQRFPTDFNGVVAGEPAMAMPGTVNSSEYGPWNAAAGILYTGNALAGHANLSPGDIRLLHKAVMARCDAIDGLKDGIIGDPRACPFKPSDIQCQGLKTSECLTAAEADVARRVYAAGLEPGSELGWIGAYVAEDGGPGRYIRRTANSYAYPYAWVFTDATNPDIRAFKAAGGKFILYNGWADEEAFPPHVVDYYETVERLMGGREQTQDFFRLFMIPGQAHIPGNVGAESTDYITALEAWVEQGKAPDVLTGHKLKYITQMMGPMYLPKDLEPSNYLYSRPIYPYPIQAKYSGKGDPDDAASFKPWTPSE
jgi:feruloyl esterase